MNSNNESMNNNVEEKESKNDKQSPSPSSLSTIIIVPACSHHVRQPLCTTRPPYRKGKKETAVKAYTIADESVYLLVQNVPSLNGVDVKSDLKLLCSKFGNVVQIESVQFSNSTMLCNSVQQPPSFTQMFLVKYSRFVDAIKAKKAIDDFVLLGLPLHICYAPEFENADDTLDKIKTRERYVRLKIAQLKNLTNK